MTQEDDAATAHANGPAVVHVSTPIVILSALPLFLISGIVHKLDLGIQNELFIAIIRSFVQLMILGLILHPIFVMGMDVPWLVGICECK